MTSDFGRKSQTFGVFGCWSPGIDGQLLYPFHNSTLSDSCTKDLCKSGSAVPDHSEGREGFERYRSGRLGRDDPKMEVSVKMGPQIMNFHGGFSIENHPAIGGTPIFSETSISGIQIFRSHPQILWRSEGMSRMKLYRLAHIKVRKRLATTCSLTLYLQKKCIKNVA